MNWEKCVEELVHYHATYGRFPEGNEWVKKIQDDPSVLCRPMYIRLCTRDSNVFPYLPAHGDTSRYLSPDEIKALIDLYYAETGEWPMKKTVYKGYRIGVAHHILTAWGTRPKRRAFDESDSSSCSSKKSKTSSSSSQMIIDN
jgi:hypothetical protein